MKTEGKKAKKNIQKKYVSLNKMSKKICQSDIQENYIRVSKKNNLACCEN